MQYAYFCYHRKDDNMLETCIYSLRMVNQSVKVVITTDGVPGPLKQALNTGYEPLDWIDVQPQQMVRRRATCKIEMLKRLIDSCKDNDEILVSDVDVYFLKDPMTAFHEFSDIDLGVTTRGYQHLFPINGGIFYITVNSKMRHWIDWHVKEIHKPTWRHYIDTRRQYKHEHFGLDWSVGQDFLVTCWNHKDELDINVVDVGPKYNYCPPTDTMGKRAFDMARAAITDNYTVTLHLKSQLKTLLYELNTLPNVKLNYPKGNLVWC